MTARAAAPNRPDTRAGRDGAGSGLDGLANLVRAEWTKFRTVRGWVIGMIAAALITVLIGYVTAAGSHTGCGPSGDPVISSTRLDRAARR